LRPGICGVDIPKLGVKQRTNGQNIGGGFSCLSAARMSKAEFLAEGHSQRTGIRTMSKLSIGWGNLFCYCLVPKRQHRTV
jgi:hypothetical protein